MLNDLTRPRNEYHCRFRKRRDMASFCHYVWMHFFWHTRPGDPRVDLSVWEIGETVRVRPASTAIDESNPAFERPPPLFFEVKGYRQERRKIERRKNVSEEEIAADLAALERELWDSMLRAIVEGLDYKNARESYGKFNPDGRPFAAVATPKDEGLDASDLTLVWRNERGPTVAAIRRRAKAAKGRPLPTNERDPSPRQQHLEKLKKTEKKQAEAAKKYWAREKEKAEKRKPAARRKFARRIAEAMAALPEPAGRQPAAKRARWPFSLDDGNQRGRLVVPTVTLDTLVDIHVTYKWTNFDEYDNRVHEYSYALLNPAIKKARARQPATLWHKLNRPQKVFFTLLDFVGEVDNGGVWQFLFNAPELSLAALETFEELGATKLAGDYRRTLEEFVGKADTVARLRQCFEDRKLDSAKRWTAFVRGYRELETTERIEKYFYTAKFKCSLFKKMSDHIESSLHLLAQIPDLSDG